MTDSAKASEHAPIELVPWPEILEEHLRRAIHMVTDVRARSPFYQRKFLDHTNLRTWSDFAELPFTEKSELRNSQAAHPPFGDYLATDFKNVIQIQTSSGTSGHPTYVPGTAEDVQTWAEMCARVKAAVGIRREDVVLQVTAMGKGFVGGVPTTQGLSKLGAAALPIGAEAGVDRLVAVIEDMRPSAIVGTPSFAQYLGGEVERRLGTTASAFGVRLVAVGGEPGGGIPAVRARMELVWGGSRPRDARRFRLWLSILG